MGQDTKNSVAATKKETAAEVAAKEAAPKAKRVTKKTEVKEVETQIEQDEIVIKQDLLTDRQLRCLQRCLGWNDENIPVSTVKNGQPVKVLYSYRNRYYTDPKPYLDEMVQKGIFEKGQFGIRGITYDGYKATAQGIKFLEEAAGICVISVEKRRNK